MPHVSLARRRPRTEMCVVVNMHFVLVVLSVPVLSGWMGVRSTSVLWVRNWPLQEAGPLVTGRPRPGVVLSVIAEACGGCELPVIAPS